MKLRYAITAIIVVFLFSGCTAENAALSHAPSDDDTNLTSGDPDLPSDTMPVVYPGYVELPIGEEIMLSVSGNLSSLTFTSSNPSVASVNGDGLITAVSVGEARIQINQSELGCTVRVTEGDKILLYRHQPDPNPDGDPPPDGDDADTPSDDSQTDQQDQETEEDIPVEHDPELDIPVEVNPDIDEFIWTIDIDEEKVKDIESPLGNMSLITEFALTATKQGGKTPLGRYDGRAFLSTRMDTGEVAGELNESSNGLVSLFSNIAGSANCHKMAFDIVRFDYDAFDANPQIASNTNYKYMACDVMEFEGSVNLDISVQDATGLKVGQDDGSGDSVADSIGYRMKVHKDGYVFIELIGYESLWFEGRITKKPIPIS